MEKRQRDLQGRFSKENNSLHRKQISFRIHKPYYSKLEQLAQQNNCSITELGRDIVEAALDLLEVAAEKKQSEKTVMKLKRWLGAAITEKAEREGSLDKFAS